MGFTLLEQAARQLELCMYTTYLVNAEMLQGKIIRPQRTSSAEIWQAIIEASLGTHGLKNSKTFQCWIASFLKPSAKYSDNGNSSHVNKVV